MESQLYFSIIVPIYNAEKFLSILLDSVLRQTFSNYEVLLVNDGSTDNTQNVCEEYCKKDTRFKYFEIPNCGPGPARNYAIGESAGKYLLFFDSDDYIADDYLEIVHDNIEKSTERTLIITNRVDVSGNKIVPKFKHEKVIDNLFLINNYYTTSIYRIPFDTQLVKNNTIMYDALFCLEDGLFILKYLSVFKPTKIHEVLANYYKVERKDSIIHSDKYDTIDAIHANRKYIALPHLQKYLAIALSCEWPTIAKNMAIRMYDSTKKFIDHKIKLVKKKEKKNHKKKINSKH